MQQQTIVSTLPLPATVILGFFGTSFEGIPLYDRGNFWITVTSIVLVSAVILLLFRRRGWL